MLDASAVDAYSGGAMSVGQILADIADANEEGDAVRAALPALSLAQACSLPALADAAVRLAGLPQVVVVGFRADNAVPAGTLALRAGGPGRLPIDTAAALLVARQNDASLLTAYRQPLVDLGLPGADERIIAIREHW